MDIGSFRRFEGAEGGSFRWIQRALGWSEGGWRALLGGWKELLVDRGIFWLIEGALGG